jgi:DNA (cytosine-5)-methyltransferase 3A
VKLKVLSLCDGISCGLEALKRLGLEVEYHAVEISKNKRFISDLNHPGIIRPYNDVLEMAEAEISEHYDLFLAGPTCTSLSSQGPRTEWEGESKIFFDCLKILNKCREINPDIKFLFENVASMRNVVRDEISQHLGVSYFEGRSELVSAQDRVRYYWFNWPHPIIEDRGIESKSVLDSDGLHLLAFSKSNRNKKGETPIVEGRIKAKAKSNTLTTGPGCNGQSTMNKVITKNMSIRNLSVAECSRLQGVGNYSFDFVSDATAYEALGDGWQVDTVVEILRSSL